MAIPFRSASAFWRWFSGVSLALLVLGVGYRIWLLQRWAAARAAAQAEARQREAQIHQNVKDLVKALDRIAGRDRFSFSREQAEVLLPSLKRLKDVEALSPAECRQFMGQVRQILTSSQRRALQAIQMNLPGLQKAMGLEVQELEAVSFEASLARLIQRLEMAQKGPKRAQE